MSDQMLEGTSKPVEDQGDSSNTEESEEEVPDQQAKGPPTTTTDSNSSEYFHAQQRQQQQSPSLADGRFDGKFTNYLKYQPHHHHHHQPQSSQQTLVNNYVLEDSSSNVAGAVGTGFQPQLMSPSGLVNATEFPNNATEANKSQHVDEEDIDDPPTDYSLQFQETDEPEVTEGNVAQAGEQDVPCEAVKTYYTEGTPFDTPFIISNAASVDDLTTITVDHVDHIDHDHDDPNSNKLASGLQTPASDRPQVYATEGTPACFSRADSLSSLGSNDLDNGPNRNNGEEKGQLEATEGPSEKEQKQKHDHHQAKQAGQLKTVSFLPEEQTQTPLMFSPCSSFESLNSFVQQPFQSGYSSCDFSRVTSGRVSPSDLPDSPCQSRPYSPTTTRKQPLETQKGFLRQSQEPKPSAATPEESADATTTTATPLPITAAADETEEHRNEQKEFLDYEADEDVFEDEDGIKTYHVEGTPAIISGRASLSDITLSDDENEQQQPHQVLKK
jgi:hypothetical protein